LAVVILSDRNQQLPAFEIDISTGITKGVCGQVSSRIKHCTDGAEAEVLPHDFQVA
jgi:hypothetical protein